MTVINRKSFLSKWKKSVCTHCGKKQSHKNKVGYTMGKEWVDGELLPFQVFKNKCKKCKKEYKLIIYG